MREWTEQDSRNLDFENLRIRAVPPSPKQAPPSAPTTVGYTDRRAPRGEATPAELQRRTEADRAMRIRARNQGNAQAPRRRPWPLPEPKQATSGRWQARVVHRGRVYQRTFDTKRQARDFINQVVNGEQP